MNFTPPKIKEPEHDYLKVSEDYFSSHNAADAEPIEVTEIPKVKKKTKFNIPKVKKLNLNKLDLYTGTGVFGGALGLETFVYSFVWLLVVLLKKQSTNQFLELMSEPKLIFSFSIICAFIFARKLRKQNRQMSSIVRTLENVPDHKNSFNIPKDSYADLVENLKSIKTITQKDTSCLLSLIVFISTYLLWTNLPI